MAATSSPAASGLDGKPHLPSSPPILLPSTLSNQVKAMLPATRSRRDTSFGLAVPPQKDTATVDSKVPSPAPILRRSRRGSSPPDPDLLRPPVPLDPSLSPPSFPRASELSRPPPSNSSDSDMSEDSLDDEDDYDQANEQADEDWDDEDDEDFIPTKLSSKANRKSALVPSLKRKASNITPASIKPITPRKVRILEPSWDLRPPSESKAFLTSEAITPSSADAKPSPKPQLSPSDLADIANGSTELRTSFTSAFNAVFAAQHAIANLAQDELGRLIVWLSSIKDPAPGTAVKIDWLAAFREHLHGTPGDLIPFQDVVEKAFENVGWDRSWEKHALHSMGVEKRMQLLCALLGMYLETKRPDPSGERRFVRVRSVPETDWELVCGRQGADIGRVYGKIKIILTRLRNLCRPELKKGKIKTPLSKEFVASDDEEGDDGGVRDLEDAEPRATRASRMGKKREVDFGLADDDQLEDEEGEDEDEDEEWAAAKHIKKNVNGQTRTSSRQSARMKKAQLSTPPADERRDSIIPKHDLTEKI